MKRKQPQQPSPANAEPTSPTDGTAPSGASADSARAGTSAAAEAPCAQTVAGTPAVAAAAAEMPVTAEELSALRQKAQLADVHWDKYLRLAADFENYKKRVARELQESARRERESVICKLLPTLDALEHGLAAVETQPPAVAEGLKLVRNMLSQVLAECGAQEIPAEGQRFDPVLHHAVSQEHSETAAADTVLRQTRKGYRMGQRVLRAADVVVSLGAPSAESKSA